MARKPGILQLLALKIDGIGEPYFFLGKSDQVEGIKETTGVEKATDKQQNKPRISVGELIRSGVAERLTLSYEKNSKLYYAKIIVASDKAHAAINGLEGKGFNGGKIIKAYRKTEDSFV